ncbi:hypothetical protein B296_00029079 [Ensete ventricosum]|uniref:Uncharacterized protein n=1 Tax=Ensete ventricosum TaxID=4639 RepID=A0A426YTP2_ENSVE|nr:hypothetical protein B296_00029079 [Ensete ventricosum]
MDGCDILFSFCLRVRLRLAHTSGWGLLTHRNLFWRERKRKSCAGSHVSSEYWGPKRLFVWIWLSLCLARARVLLTFAHPRSDSQAFYTDSWPLTPLKQGVSPVMILARCLYQGIMRARLRPEKTRRSLSRTKRRHETIEAQV